MADEKVFTIHLRPLFQVTRGYQRVKVAVRETKAFLKRHVKHDVLLGRYLNMKLHEGGRSNPPHRIQVRVWQEKDAWKADLVGAPVEQKVEEKKPAEAKPLEVKADEQKESLEEEKKEVLEHPKEKKDKVKVPVEKGKKRVLKAGEQTHHAEVFSKSQKPTHEKKK